MKIGIMSGGRNDCDMGKVFCCCPDQGNAPDINFLNDLLFRRVAGDSPRSIWRSSRNSSGRMIIIILYGAHWGSSYSRRAYKAPDKDDLISVAPRIAYIQNVNPLLQCPPAPYFR